MTSIKNLDEPIKEYQSAKEAFNQNAEEYFSNLIKESNTNVEANKSTCNNYYQKLTDIEAMNKTGRKKKRLKNFLRVLEVICYILFVLIPVGILIHKKIKNQLDKEIENNKGVIDKLTKEADELKNIAIKQTALLNSLYDWHIAPTLVSKTIPLIKMDKIFDPAKYQYLHDKYGFNEHLENDISTIFVQSGSILGNPFLIEQNYVQEISPHIYTGTLVVHYTTHIRGSDGRMHSVPHTETLVATVSKPKPMYYLDTWLIYGNGAAPKLTFTRQPSKASSMNEKDLKRFTHKFEKQLDKKAHQDTNFTKMSNTQFESLFNALNRDNEVEFRLLFTPLAQSNMINLIKSKEPYGDDFIFSKQHELNYIKTTHSQNFDYSSNPVKFIDFDVSKAKEAFLNYCNDYFTHFYFDIAPLISIPLYQNYKAQEYIYKDNHRDARITRFEAESLANQFPEGSFSPSGSIKEAIYKTKFIKRDNDNDLFCLTAYTFKGVPRLTMVPRIAGNGRTYLVPVHWIEYIPIHKDNSFVVKNINKTRQEYLLSKNVFNNMKEENVYYQKGLVGALLNSK